MKCEPGSGLVERYNYLYDISARVVIATILMHLTETMLFPCGSVRCIKYVEWEKWLFQTELVKCSSRPPHHMVMLSLSGCLGPYRIHVGLGQAKQGIIYRADS